MQGLCGRSGGHRQADLPPVRTQFRGDPGGTIDAYAVRHLETFSMSRPRNLITPAIFLSASIVAGSSVDEAPDATADDGRTSTRPAACSAPSGIYGMLARSAHVCHTR
jgi:hypothetical protein